jgi:uncharacterized lipoprotein YmbA
VRSSPSARGVIGAALAAAVLAGCTLLEPRPDPSRYFVLHPVVPAGTPAGVSVGLGPVSLPGYLRRPELLTRASAAEVSPADVERWGEPLDEALPRVLGRDLALALGTLDVRAYPWFREAQPDVQITVDVERFEREGDEAVVAARFEVRDLRAGGRAVARAAEHRAPAASADAAATVDALSAALGALAGELAAAVRELAARR